MPRVDHPWGVEEIWAETEHYVARSLVLRPGASPDPPRQGRGARSLRIQAGFVALHIEGAGGARELGPGESAYVPGGVSHRLVALTEAEVVEIAAPEIAVAAAPDEAAPDLDIVIDDLEPGGSVPPPPLPPPRPAMLRPGAKVVVVVEDDLPIQDLLVRALGAHYTVYRADDGAHAIALVEALPPVDLIVTDLMMPAVSGLDLIRHLKADPERSRIPIIILSARTASGDVAQAINAGARSYLTKPFKLKELLAQVDRLAGTR